MSKKKILLDRMVRCPKCKRNMRPRVLESVEPIVSVAVPIPERLIVRCQAIGCGEKFYIPANADK